MDVPKYIEVFEKMTPEDSKKHEEAVHIVNQMDGAIHAAQIERGKAVRKVRRILSKYV